MADYTAPFHMPKFTDTEFESKKAEYVQKHGYSITIPRFDDIVHMGLHKPMTEQEKVLWYSGRRKEIGRSRQIELYAQKERSRERYHKMLASPVPNVVSNITSVLAAVDDTQDAIISLAAIGRIACWFLPRFVTTWLAWPIGVLRLIATIMGLLIAPSACVLNPMACKRYMRLKLAMRKYSLKARVAGRDTPWIDMTKTERAEFKAAKRGYFDRTKAVAKYQKDRMGAGLKGYATSGKFYPSFSEGIQMLQVTDNIYESGYQSGRLSARLTI